MILDVEYPGPVWGTGAQMWWC